MRPRCLKTKAEAGPDTRTSPSFFAPSSMCIPEPAEKNPKPLLCRWSNDHTMAQTKAAIRECVREVAERELGRASPWKDGLAVSCTGPVVTTMENGDLKATVSVCVQRLPGWRAAEAAEAAQQRAEAALQGVESAHSRAAYAAAEAERLLEVAELADIERELWHDVDAVKRLAEGVKRDREDVRRIMGEAAQAVEDMRTACAEARQHARELALMRDTAQGMVRPPSTSDDAETDVE